MEKNKNVFNFEQFNENYLSGIANKLISKDWDELYSDAQEEPIKSKIKNILVDIFNDEDVLVAVADNYEWTDGSNGFINFSNLNHFITDIGYKTYADDPNFLSDVDEFKKHILYSYASSGDDHKRGEKYRNFEYNPNDEFQW
jgi:hypothetical protein